MNVYTIPIYILAIWLCSTVWITAIIERCNLVGTVSGTIISSAAIEVGDYQWTLMTVYTYTYNARVYWGINIAGIDGPLTTDEINSKYATIVGTTIDVFLDTRAPDVSVLTGELPFTIAGYDANAMFGLCIMVYIAYARYRQWGPFNPPRAAVKNIC